MDPPKCPLCERRHWSKDGCKGVVATTVGTAKVTPLKANPRRSVPGAMSIEDRLDDLEDRVEKLEKRKKYQRDYMRKKRAKD